MSATSLGLTIAFPFILGPLVGYAHYHAQIADYEAKNGVTPSPKMLHKIKHCSIALAFQISCTIGGWTLAYELAVPMVDALIGLFHAGALGSTPAYWVTVFAVGLLSALFVVIACLITQHYLRAKGITNNQKINYGWLAVCAFAAGALFMLCFAVPGQIGLKNYLLNELGLIWSKIICGLFSSILIGTSVTAVSACYNYKENLESLKNDPGSNCAAIKGFFGGNPQSEQGPRLAF
jgi:hypothetical protein